MRNKYRGPASYHYEEVLERFQIRLPPETSKILHEISRERMIPVSRLILYAIDNELFCKPPFSFNAELPTTEYKEDQYPQENSKVFNFIKKFQTGIGIDLVVLCRRDFGIDDPNKVLECLRDLKERRLIETYYPSRASFRYAKDYKYVRVHRDLISNDVNNRKKQLKVLTNDDKGVL